MDLVKAGVPLLLLTYLVTLTVAPLIFPFKVLLIRGSESMNKPPLFLMTLLALVASPPAFSQAASLEELQQRCQAAREKKIAPLREAAIEECASNRRSSRTRADCERIYAGFGGGGGTVDGGARPAMFNDLPECVEYFEALDRQRTGSRR
jgi:hypothetical protein